MANPPFCAACGKAVPPEAAFCPSCGVAVGATSPAPRRKAHLTRGWRRYHGMSGSPGMTVGLVVLLVFLWFCFGTFLVLAALALVGVFWAVRAVVTKRPVAPSVQRRVEARKRAERGTERVAAKHSGSVEPGTDAPSVP